MTAYIVFTRERMRNVSYMEAYAPAAWASFADHDPERLAAYGKCETLEGRHLGADYRAFITEGV